MTSLTARRVAVVVLGASVLLTAACSSAHPSSTSDPSPTAPAGSASPAPSPTSSSAAASGSAVASPTPSPVRSATVRGADGRRRTVEVFAERTDKLCYQHAHGQVTTFLTTHPCRGMRRLLGTTTVQGRPVGLSVITTSFDGSAADPYADTSAFRALVERDGTGSIDDLLLEGDRLPAGPTALPDPDAFACLTQDNGVSIFDLWYLDGGTPRNDPALESVARELFLQL